MSQADYLVLVGPPEQANNDFNSEITNYDSYLSTVRLLQRYSKFEWGSPEELHFLASLSEASRSRLYTLFSAVTRYIDNKLLDYEIEAENIGSREIINRWDLGDDLRNHVAMMLAVRWPNSYVLLEQPSFRPKDYENWDYPRLSDPEMTEEEIAQLPLPPTQSLLTNSRKRARLDELDSY